MTRCQEHTIAQRENTHNPALELRPYGHELILMVLLEFVKLLPKLGVLRERGVEEACGVEMM